ncbi:MAG: hypothetical protein J4215_00145 [Candidatus Diapherotrites archaeon]|uniref:Lon proteolytic domain-containing protein n=1 Tax=Candidatus Iainarchaeum sp. TaxID=3101447 RepID=A0A8T4L3E4_9ARCH|nr:hypothetical protein [Candidatus Diapherotrites archaeon]
MVSRVWYSLVLLFFLVGSLHSVFAVLEQNSLKIFAITDDGQGLSADLTLDVETGNGKIWTSVTPLVGTSTQNAERTAVELAKKYSSRVGQFDYKFEISSSASIVDGPSAGAATAFLVISSLNDKPISKDVGLTGTINTDGTVGPVGGVFEKAREANRIGIKLFMIPRGEAKQVVKLPDGVKSINLVEYAPREWGMKVVEVQNIDQIIQYASSDISKIDVNQQIEQTLADFLPSPIAYSPQTQPLADITQKYLSESKTLVSEAKNALNTTTLTDRQLIDIMLDSMNESERVMERASNLFDQNFLYSSANYSFLAKVNALLIKDIAQNPSLLNESSVLFHSKLVELQKELDQLKPSVDSGLISENIDWQISAQQRLAWSQNGLDKLVNNQTIIIGPTPGAESDYTVQVDRLNDYEFAIAWKDVAMDLSQDLKKGRKSNGDATQLNEYIQTSLIAAENGLTQLNDEDFEDIRRRFESAQQEQKNGWVLAAATDAAAASYLAQAELFSRDKNVSVLKAELQRRITELDTNLSKTNRPYSWTYIYLDHARFFLQGVNYYVDHNQTSAALSMAKSGISIVYLASSSFESSNQLYDFYDSLPEQMYDFQPVPSRIETTVPGTGINLNDYLLFLAVIIVILSWVVIAVLLQKHSKARQDPWMTSTQDPERSAQKQVQDLDQKLSDGKISIEQYRAQKESIEEKKKAVEELQKRESREVVEADELKARVKALESEIKLLRKDYGRGLILTPDYVDSVETTRQQLEKTENQLKAKKKTVTKIEKNKK